ncbi:cell division protein ZapA [Novispirillum sp. DQ9]|uniref:cell division protein ZapA n=1 Tax=Novispirillum sp. DQ9 TaxID=3398612 RepID=UPI003C7A11CD
MAQVSVMVNGRAYQVGCADGQEDRVLFLAKELDARARLLAEASGSLNEGLVLVLAGLMIADETHDERAAREAAEEELAVLRAGDQASALQARVDDLEDQLARTQTELAEAHAALRAAHERLEQRRDDAAARGEQEARVAEAIEALAARIETVAESLRAP